MNTVAFQNNCRFVGAEHAIRLYDFVSEGERAVDAGNAVVQDDIGLLAHGAQNLTASQRGTDGVAIGTGVRSQHETLVLPDLPEHIFQHVVSPSFHWLPRETF